MVLSAFAKRQFPSETSKGRLWGGVFFFKKDFLEKNSAVFNWTFSYSKSGTNFKKVKRCFHGHFQQVRLPPLPRAELTPPSTPLAVLEAVWKQTRSKRTGQKAVPGERPGAGLQQKRRGSWVFFSLLIYLWGWELLSWRRCVG